MRWASGDGEMDSRGDGIRIGVNGEAAAIEPKSIVFAPVIAVIEFALLDEAAIDVVGEFVIDADAVRGEFESEYDDAYGC